MGLYREHVYLAMNKPGGRRVLASRLIIPSERLYGCCHSPLRRRAAFRRSAALDQDTTGLLLFSDDGQFIHRYTSPRKEHRQGL